MGISAIYGIQLKYKCRQRESESLEKDRDRIKIWKSAPSLECRK